VLSTCYDNCKKRNYQKISCDNQLLNCVYLYCKKLRMKYLLTYIIYLLSLCIYGQNVNTFFVTKLSDHNKIKVVFKEGEKLKVNYTQSDNQNVIKGFIDEIGDTYIIVESVRIDLNEIAMVSAHKPGIKVLGGILFSAGTALIVKGFQRKENPKYIEKETVNFVGLGGGGTKTVVRDSGGLILMGSILCAASSIGIIIPTICHKDKYRFATHTNN